ncbi:MAG: hypothetical protein GXZ06_02500 [Tissierellia bacterium]|nr:hypothetical protein [Tissierellia bacterium]
MFPRGLLIFIMLLVIDVISKSIKDKKKIEESRRKKLESLSKDKNIEKNPFEEKKEIDYGEKLPEYIVEVKAKKNEFSNDIAHKEDIKEVKEVYKRDIGDNWIIKEEEEINNKKIKKKKMKKDLLKGIIFSEILSEPKSLRNMKRSI